MSGSLLLTQLIPRSLPMARASSVIRWIVAFGLCAAAIASLPTVAAAVSPHAGGVGQNTCSTCHVPHEAATRRGIFRKTSDTPSETSVCYSCHDGSGASSNVKTGTDSFGLASGHILESLTDTTTTEDLTNTCSGCHAPHGDPALRPKLLSSSVNSATVTATGNEWCLACHNDEQDWYAQIGSYPSLAAPVRDASGYPTSGVFAGASVYADVAANPHAAIPASGSSRSVGDCLYCHNAHGSASPYDSLVATLAPSAAGNAAHDRSTGDYAALCLGCHGGGSWETSGAANIKQYVTNRPSDVGNNSSGGHRIKSAGGNLPVNAPLPCYDCHNPHGSSRGNTSLLSDALGGSLDTSGSPQAVRQFCLSCHVTSELLGWDSASGAYASVPATAAVEGLLRTGGAAGSGPDGGHNWLRLKDVPGHRSADTSASCYDCHGDEYTSADSHNVHSPGLYTAEQHTVGGPCVTSGCHSTDAYTIHQAGPECSACHDAGTTPSLVCGVCHVGDQHPTANHVNSSPCYGCHEETNLMSVHGDDCSKCHSEPAQGMTYTGGCSQTGCHTSLHPDPWPTATYEPGHSAVGWGHSDWGNDCWDCHEVNAWEGTSCTTPYCHPHVYERVAPTTTSNAAGPYTGIAIITLTATDAGGYWGGPDAQWFISGVRDTYYQVNGGDLQTGTSIIVVPPTSGTTRYTIEFWSTDNNYNTEEHHVVSFDVTAAVSGDVSPPGGTMSVNSDAAYANVAAVTVNSTVTDAETGVSFMRIDPGTGSFGSWVTYAASHAITLSAGDGSKTVRVEYMDGANNRVVLSDAIMLDTTRPTGSVSVNNGDSTTDVTGVALNLSATDALSGVSQMRFSNDNVTWSSWETYASTKSWTLSSGNGLKTVYVQYRDDAGNVSSTYSDAITLFDGIDPTPPVGSVTVNAGAAYTNTSTVTLTLSASDAGGSGLAQMRFSNDNVTWSSWETYASTKSWTLSSGDGLKTAYVQFRDGAGNISISYSDTITVSAGATSFLAFRWWGYGYAELHVENSMGVTIASTTVEGALADLSWDVSVPAGQHYRMVCDYYWDDDWGDEGGGYGIWTNDASINPDGILSPGETVTWNY